jgi:hypothetical protein
MKVDGGQLHYVDFPVGRSFLFTIFKTKKI